MAITEQSLRALRCICLLVVSNTQGECAFLVVCLMFLVVVVVLCFFDFFFFFFFFF